MSRAALASAALLLAVAARAHPEIDDALARLNPLLAAQPANASLYLERGELYAKHQDSLAAEANFLRAAELAPNLPGLARARGALALATGQITEAREQLDRALATQPSDAEALIFRSRVHVALHDRAAALADLERALTLVANPRPELFLERAALHASPAAAIRSLDEAIARLGPAHTLHLRALELEVAAGQTDAALARLDLLAAASERKEHWLKRRGDLLARAGRLAEARRAYAAALAQIAALPDWLRQSPETRQLTLELQASSSS